ncbi:hypothetical protein GUJ93_ZPchr0001g29650 [Zizania palustris]|uniref:Uncharacterized protein n=1 Tax=Zizania palustris TaxID=103762 RepID=A0A8J5S851_ZIZPA|nr:hypothetical protein GUJ93_ZPchr0001g29650 [Zizania palustris]
MCVRPQAQPCRCPQTLLGCNLYAMPPPVPPSVKAGQTINGNSPISSAMARHSSSVVPMPDGGVLRPILSMACLNSCRSSAARMAGREAHAEAVQRARVGERDGEVERGLATHGREQRVGSLGRDDALDQRRRAFTILTL